MSMIKIPEHIYDDMIKTIQTLTESLETTLNIVKDNYEDEEEFKSMWIYEIGYTKDGRKYF